MRNTIRLSAFCAALFVVAALGLAHEHAYPPPAYMLHTSGQVYILPHPMHAAHGVAVPAPTYAYGWFGVVPRCHTSHHYGYYQNYTQCAER